MGYRNLVTVVMLVAAGLTYQTAGPSKDKAGAESVTRRGVTGRQTGGETEIKGLRLPGSILLDGTYPRNIVALVPDPVRTHMALNFDRAIDSIIAAATDQELTLQAYFIPWER